MAPQHHHGLPDEERMALAMADIAKGKYRLREAAGLYNVKPSTLSDRMRGRKPRQKAQTARQRLPEPKERVMVEWCQQLALTAHPLNRNDPPEAHAILMADENLKLNNMLCAKVQDKQRSRGHFQGAARCYTMGEGLEMKRKEAEEAGRKKREAEEKRAQKQANQERRQKEKMNMPRPYKNGNFCAI
ncbi:hypothetical protein B0H17DRAFT_1144515 [Mycena rosella]|uniref:HTH psq-type domain-containing protein n=1 Tax=Mycena rosella TaxID=1033263 RepID=A0AAD7CWK1_MYCRO|nr:hypothetical protein B0H17DRAFT_1144515 [Mycena rosella]